MDRRPIHIEGWDFIVDGWDGLGEDIRPRG